MAHLTLDDFEWKEQGFDSWVLVHKQRVFVIAGITHYNGWHVRIRNGGQPFTVDTLDAAKVIAKIHVQPYMEKYSNAINNYQARRLLFEGPVTEKAFNNLFRASS